MTNHNKRNISKPPIDISNRDTIRAITDGGFATAFRGTECKRVNMSSTWKRLINETDINVSQKFSKPAFLRLVSNNEQFPSEEMSSSEQDAATSRGRRSDAMSNWIRRLESSNGEEVFYGCRAVVATKRNKINSQDSSLTEGDIDHFVFYSSGDDSILNFEGGEEAYYNIVFPGDESGEWSALNTFEVDGLFKVLIECLSKDSIYLELGKHNPAWTCSQDASESRNSPFCPSNLAIAIDGQSNTGAADSVMCLLYALSILEQQVTQASNGETSVKLTNQLRTHMLSLLKGDDFLW